MRKGSFTFWTIFIAAAITRFLFSYLAEDIPDATSCLKQTVSGSGVVIADPERKESGQILIVSAEKFFADDRDVPCVSNIKIKLKTKLYPRFSYGDRVSVSGKFSAPFNFSSDDGRQFDYRGYLAKDHIFYEMKSAKVELTGSELRKKDLQYYLYSVKHSFVSNLERVLGEPHAALAAGLVVGEKSALGASLIDDFRTVGLIHIVVLSGFNITIIAVALRRILSFLPRVWGIVIGALGIVFFGILVGGGATVVRSCFMAGIALAADLIRRDYSVHRALAFAALIMLIENPLILLHDPSFQLSFLATLGLVLLAKPIENKLLFITEKFGMRGTVATTLATQIFVSPYILYMMGQISIIGVVVNILVLPFIPLTMLLVFLTGAGGFILEQIGTVFGWLTHILLSYELFLVEKFADVPYASLYIPPFSFWWVLGFYAIFSATFFIFRARPKRA